MAYLKHGIGLPSAAQLDPLVAYKNEAFELFGDLMNTIWSDFARMIYHVEVTVQEDPAAQAEATPRRRPSPANSSATGGARVSYSGGATVPAGAQAIASAAAAEAATGLG